MTNNTVSSLWNISHPGRRAVDIPSSDVPSADIPDFLKRDSAPELPEVGSLDLVRHYTRLSQLNFSIDSHFYPLGSCTMKYNPRINEKTARMEGFAASHPYLRESEMQGNLELMFKLQEALMEVSGFKAVSLQPAAGAHGELAGVLMIKKYHQSRGDTARTRFLIPDSAHGTNPASVAMAGFEAVEVPSDKRGNIDLIRLKELCDDTVAGIMITNPNTLGLFEEDILDVLETVHKCGGLAYGDGANFNAIMGVAKPGELGFDVLHFNLHKTFSTPPRRRRPRSGTCRCRQGSGTLSSRTYCCRIRRFSRRISVLYAYRVHRQAENFLRKFRSPCESLYLYALIGRFGYERCHIYGCS